jgi:hypothetical protein
MLNLQLVVMHEVFSRGHRYLLVACLLSFLVMLLVDVLRFYFKKGAETGGSVKSEGAQK